MTDTQVDTKKHGRPRKYTESLANQVLRRLSEGESLNRIAKSRDMPSRTTVYRWIFDDVDGFRGKYAIAKEEASDAMYEQLMDICEEEEDVARARLKVDTIKWMLGKQKPKKFGDKQIVEHDLHSDLPDRLEAAMRRVARTRKAIDQEYADAAGG